MTINYKEKKIGGEIFFISEINDNIKLPFLLFIPKDVTNSSSLIVDIFSGKKSVDDFNTVINETLNTRTKYISDIVKKLSVENNNPILMPIIPNFKGYYTCFFGSQVRNNDTTILEENILNGVVKIDENDIEKIKNIDFQVLGMIEESKKIINKKNNIVINDKVIMHGYSAGGHFVNGFTALHPELISTEIVGGIDGMAILPFDNINGQKLNYPIGISDIPNFDKTQYSKIRHVFYIGDNDFQNCAEINNGKAKYRTCYTDAEVKLINNIYGNISTHDRMKKINEIYNSNGYNSELIMAAGNHMTVQINQRLADKISINDKKKPFTWESKSEEIIYNQIKQKNQIIKQQKEQKRQMNKPKVKTLTAPSQGGNVSKGFTNVITLSLIVSFVSGALFMVMYMLLGGK